VSTGTGSGKPECFLYPIISRCLELKDLSERVSRAVLEMLVHLDPHDAVRYLTFRVEFDEALVERWPADQLPSGWREEMPARAGRRLGDTWAHSSRSAILAVPSVIIPEELNYLLNPAHPDFKKMRTDKSLSIADIWQALRISRATFYRYLAAS
jgi:RES domain-containing protein